MAYLINGIVYVPAGVHPPVIRPSTSNSHSQTDDPKLKYNKNTQTDGEFVDRNMD